MSLETLNPSPSGASSTPPPPVQPSDVDRALGIVNYVLMFFAHWGGFLPAVVAVVIAYARRGEAGAVDRSHYDFQIRTFWIGFWLVIAGLAAGAFALFGGLGAAIFHADDATGAAMGFGMGSVALGIIAIACFVISFLWTLIASAFGGIKQLTGNPIGPRRA